jgi:hypothetical protein|tara:strand:+ start:1731 stop:2369 length:639 start_codon:yes stop_codon:yes gene_type:complete
MPKILHWLLPKEEEFFRMLGEQASTAVEAVDDFSKLVYDYNILSDLKKKELVSKIEDLEDKGDNLTHKIIGDLDKTFITPIDKEDIHRLAMLLDDVIDLIHMASERMLIFKITRINSHIMNFTDIVIKIVKRVEEGVMDIDKLKNMNQFYVDVRTLENKGDVLFNIALARLFDKKDAIEIIRYKNIYEFLEEIINKCEDIANVMESIVVKHA